MRTEARGGLALADGSFKFPLGVKRWPRKTNVRMWRGWDEGAVLDIRAVKSIGARAVRLFAGPGLRERQRRLESAAREAEMAARRLGDNGMAGFVTLLVGHMSGRNWAESFSHQ